MSMQEEPEELRVLLSKLKTLDIELERMQNIEHNIDHHQKKLTKLTKIRNTIWNTIVKHDKLPNEIGKMHQDYEKTVENAHQETKKLQRIKLLDAAKKLREKINKKLAEIDDEKLAEIDDESSFCIVS